MFRQWTYLAGLRRAKICQLTSLHLYKEHMKNYILCLTGMTFPNHLSNKAFAACVNLIRVFLHGDTLH